MPALWGQSSKNPFDLLPGDGERTEEEMEQEEEADWSKPIDGSANPFDLQEQDEVEAVSIAPDQDLPLLVEEEKEESTPDPAKPALTNDGFLLFITLGLLLLTTIVFLFFRSLYVKAYKALFNDNILSTLYRERDGGGLGRFLPGYLVFFLSAGLFLFYAARQFEWLPEGNMVHQIGFLTTGMFFVFLIKHIVLSILGGVFPVTKEVKKYSFTIMLFSFFLGLVLAFAAFLLLYGPESWKKGMIIGVGVVVLLVYLLRSIRGLFIGNRFLTGNFFHFLLYICAIEIIPTLFLYKILTSNIG